MKHLFSLALRRWLWLALPALLLLLAPAARAQSTYATVPLTAGSFTADVIANGAAANPPAASTTADADGAMYYLISQDYYSSTTTHASGLPNSGAIPTSLAASPSYQLRPYAGNNSLRLAGTSSGTVTFATPRTADEVFVLVCSGSDASAMNVTVNYADGTSTPFTGLSTPDWYAVNAAVNVFGASARASATVPVSATGANNTAPFLNQLRLAIPVNKLATNITSLTVAKAAGAAVLNVLAVSVGQKPRCAAAPASTQAVASTTAAGGTALTSACASTSIYLSLTGAPDYGGYTYQWQQSTTGPTTGFANISGATGATYTATGQTAATYYRCVVTCYFGGSGVASAAVLVGQNALTNCYCAPTYERGGASDFIASVALGTLSNDTRADGNPAPYYRSYTTTQNAVPALERGNTASLVLTFGGDATQYSGAWVDFNQDGEFDADEFFSGARVGGNGTATLALAVPATAVLGQTRLRIRGGDDNALTSAQACGASSSNYGEAEDYFVNIVYTCAGNVPATVTAAASVSSTCSGRSFALAATGVPAGPSGFGYQWQRSPAGAGTFAPISGATTNPYTVPSQTAASDYRLLVTCQGSPAATSNVVSVAQNFINCYCTPTYAAAGTGDFIARVRLGSLDNASTGNPSPNYRDYTTAQTGSAPTLPIPMLFPGTPATLTLNLGPDANQYSGVWIDFNQSGVFEASEFFTAGTNAGPGGTTTVSITIPATSAVVAGQTRMRIRGGDDSALTSDKACGASNSSYGEAEDYLVSIAAPVPCAGTPATTTATASTSTACPGVAFTLSATGIAPSTTGLTYQWQSRIGTTAFANISGATTNPYPVASQTAASDYRLVVTCTASSLSSTSNVVSVAQTPFTNCYCTPTGGACNNEYIRGVTLNTLSNVGTGPAGTGCTSGAYADYTGTAALTTTLIQGTAYPLTLNLRTNSAPAFGGVWLDYDHSGTFDASEFTEIYHNTTLSASTDVSGTVSITIPATALPGVTRLRVRSANSLVPLNAGGACTNNYYGEVEDYLVTLVPPAPTLTSFTPGSGPVGTTLDLTGTNLTGATAITFGGSSGNVVTTGFTVASPGSITGVVVPAGAQSGPLTVTTAGGTSAASTAAFTVCRPVASARNATALLDAGGTATLAASALDNGSSSACGPLTLRVQRVATVSGVANEGSTLTLTAPGGATFVGVTFASYGTPGGTAAPFTQGSCHATTSQARAEAAFVGNTTGSLLASNNNPDGTTNFGDPCSGTPKRLAVTAAYPVGAPAASVSFSCAEVGPQPVLLLITDASGTTATALATVTVAPDPAQTAITWTGATSADWLDCANWTYGLVPTATRDATLPGGLARYPSLPAGTFAVRSLTLASGSSLSTADGTTLAVSGSWTDHGSSTTLAGPVLFGGSGPQAITGTTGTAFGPVVVAKASGSLTLGRDLAIGTSLALSSGTLTTGTYKVVLAPTATLIETETAYVSGAVETTRPVSTPGTTQAFGGLGVALTPAAGSTVLPGSTLVRRVTGSPATGAGSSGIGRYVVITPTTDAGLDVTLALTYAEHELSGIAESRLQLFRSQSNAAGPWARVDGASYDAATNTVTRPGLASFSTWTLGDAAAPLPVELLRFTATAEGPAARLRWTTASEKNSARFEVERSTDGKAFAKMGEVAAQGSTARPSSYQYLDATSSPAHQTAYYRLRQVDRDGTSSYSPVRAVAIGAPARPVAYPAPAHAGQPLTVAHLPANTPIQLLDALGRAIATATTDATGTAALPLPAGLAAGVYVVRCGRQALRLTVE